MAKPNPLLSRREFQVLERIIEGFTDEEIAAYLYITKDTVNAHRKKIKAKLGAVNAASLVTQAFRRGLVR